MLAGHVVDAFSFEVSFLHSIDLLVWPKKTVGAEVVMHLSST